MPAGLPYLRWYPSDFMGSTAGWSVTARGVYRELLDRQWTLGELPSDPKELQLLIGATDAEWRDGWKRCASKFPSAHGTRKNGRLEDHRAKALNDREQRSNAGKAGMAKRWGNIPYNDVNNGDTFSAITRPVITSRSNSNSRSITKDPESGSAKSATGNGQHRRRKSTDLPVPPNYPDDLNRQRQETLAEITARLAARVKPPNT